MLDDFFDFLLEVMKGIIPPFYEKTNQKWIRSTLKVFWYLLIWGIALSIFGGIIWVLLRLFYAIFGFGPRL